MRKRSLMPNSRKRMKYLFHDSLGLTPKLHNHQRESHRHGKESQRSQGQTPEVQTGKQETITKTPRTRWDVLRPFEQTEAGGGGAEHVDCAEDGQKDSKQRSTGDEGYFEQWCGGSREQSPRTCKEPHTQHAQKAPAICPGLL